MCETCGKGWNERVVRSCGRHVVRGVMCRHVVKGVHVCRHVVKGVHVCRHVVKGLSCA